MDPVQLMMAAHQADAEVAAQTPDQALQAAIAQSRPDLWAPLSTNPAAYPDLLDWLASTGNVEVLANLRARGYLTDDSAEEKAGESAEDAGEAEPVAGTVEVEAESSADESDEAGVESGEGEQEPSDEEFVADVSQDEATNESEVADEAEPAADVASAEQDPEAESEPVAEDQIADEAVPVDDGADDETESSASSTSSTEEAGDEAASSGEDANDRTEAFPATEATAVLAASQWPAVDSAAEYTADSAAPAAGSAAPAAGSAESIAMPLPPPPSAEDIAAWAETPSGAPSGFSAAQPAVELDMFGPQMPPPQQQKQASGSSTGRLMAIIVVLLLVIVGGGGLWAGSYFSGKSDSSGSGDRDGGQGDKQDSGQADAAATASALPSGTVTACSSMPELRVTSVEDGQGELKVQANVTTSCADGDFLAGSSNQVLIYSTTSPTGGADTEHLVASGSFNLSGEPLIIPNGGRMLTLRFGERHYFRTAKDLDLKGLKVSPTFDRGAQSTVTSGGSTNSPMTIASSTSSGANQEPQDEQAAGQALRWQADHDRSVVMSKFLGKWTPQLSSKQVGLVADGQSWTNRAILAEFLKTRQAEPDAVLVNSSDWSVFDVGGWWVTLSGEFYGTADEANAWCDTQGYDAEHCLAKRMESSGPPQGTTKSR